MPFFLLKTHTIPTPVFPPPPFLFLFQVRARDPSFDMVAFLAALKQDVPSIVRAYLAADASVLALHASPDLVERVVRVAAATADRAPDATVLDVGDVELVDLKFLEGDPAAVVQFSAQQINCARDAHGNVVEGAPDDVQRVYYYWALVQEAGSGFVDDAGRVVAPRWVLKEVLVRGMHNLL